MNPIRAPDTDMFVMLQDYYPTTNEFLDGYRLNICDGIFRVRYRVGLARPRMIKPGAVYEVTLDLYPTSNVFAAGHEIRMLATFSSFHRFISTRTPASRSAGTRDCKSQRT